MYFLVNYSRKEGKLISIKEFSGGAIASQEKLALEIDLLGQGVGSEIVVLEADSLEDLKNSHSRYFNDLSGIKFEKEKKKEL